MINLISEAFILGLASTLHCIGMCGGLVSAFSITNKSKWNILFYNCGRIVSYIILAILVSLTLKVTGLRDFKFLRLIAGIFLIATGFYIAGFFSYFSYLDYLGKPLWSKLQPYTQRFLPADNYKKALQLGMLWGFLPCGLVYSAISVAVTKGAISYTALFMICFGLGTFPALLFLGYSTHLLSFLKQKAVRICLGLLIVIFGIINIIQYAKSTNHQAHAHQMQMKMQH